MARKATGAAQEPSCVLATPGAAPTPHCGEKPVSTGEPCAPGLQARCSTNSSIDDSTSGTSDAADAAFATSSSSASGRGASGSAAPRPSASASAASMASCKPAQREQQQQQQEEEEEEEARLVEAAAATAAAAAAADATGAAAGAAEGAAGAHGRASTSSLASSSSPSSSAAATSAGRRRRRLPWAWLTSSSSSSLSCDGGGWAGGRSSLLSVASDATEPATSETPAGSTLGSVCGNEKGAAGEEGGSGAPGQQQQQQQQQQGESKRWKRAVKKFLSNWFLFEQSELQLLQLDQRELQAIMALGIDRTAYRSAALRRDGGAYAAGDWEAIQDLLVAHASGRSSVSTRSSSALKGTRQDRDGWWRLQLDLSDPATASSSDNNSSSSSSSASASTSGKPPKGKGAKKGKGAGQQQQGQQQGRQQGQQHLTDVALWYAGVDQCSRGVQGPASCGSCALEVAAWLAAHPGRVPADAATMAALLRCGAAAWRGMCADPGLASSFPTRHFDLEAVLEYQHQQRAAAAAAARCGSAGDAGGGGGEGQQQQQQEGQQLPLMRAVPDRSFVGFLAPSGALAALAAAGGGDGLLQGCPMLSDIWPELERMAPATFIVAWDAHFCVVRLEGAGGDGDNANGGGAAYLIDSLGSRLHSLCSCAFAARFEPDPAADPAAAGGDAATPAAAAAGATPGAAAAADAAGATPPPAAAAAAPGNPSQQPQQQGQEQQQAPCPRPRSALQKLARFFERAYAGATVARVSAALEKALAEQQQQQQQGGAHGHHHRQVEALLRRLQVEVHCVEPA